MPAATLPASPPDITAILTSLGVFSLAIAAVVGGIYKGLKEAKKGEPTDTAFAGGLILDTATARALTESNMRLAEINHDVLEQLRRFDRQADNLVEAIKLQREMTRSQIEEQHRLRAAVVDLVEIMRRIRG